MKRTMLTSTGIMAIVGIIAGAMAWFGKGLLQGPTAAPPGGYPGEEYTGRVATTREQAEAFGWGEMWSQLEELKLKGEVSPVTVPLPAAGVEGLAAFDVLKQFQQEVSFGGYEPTPENVAAVTATQYSLLDAAINPSGLAGGAGLEQYYEAYPEAKSAYISAIRSTLAGVPVEQWPAWAKQYA